MTATNLIFIFLALLGCPLAASTAGTTKPLTEPGLYAQFFNDGEFKRFVASQVVRDVTGDVLPGLPVLDQPAVSVRWMGRIQPPADGKYTFYLSGGGGARLRVNGNLIIDSFMDGGGTRSGEFSLAKDKRTEVLVEMHGNRSLFMPTLEWQTGELKRQVIPVRCYTMQMPNPPADNLKTPLPFWGADPAPVVGPDGRLYIYPTDSGPSCDSAIPEDWYSYSSSDLSNWKEHGKVIGVSDLAGWNVGANRAIAPAAIVRNGTFFHYYYCHANVDGKMERVVGVASSPNGRPPFINHSIDKPLCVGIHDPDVFIDDDGQAYLLDGKSHIKLNRDMVTTSGELTPFKYASDNKAIGEATFIFKRDGIYYMLRGDHRRTFSKKLKDNEESIVYHTAKSFTGPWEYGGVVMQPSYGQSRHGSAFEFNGRWYLSYHIWEDGTMKRRRPALAELQFNPDGSIQPVQPINAGRYVR